MISDNKKKINIQVIDEDQILYEDNHIIVVNKKFSEIVQGDKTGDIPLSEKVKNYLKIKYNKTGNVFIGVPHRLDRPVSGIIIFTKTSKALSRISKMFFEHSIRKKYLAVVEAKPPKDKDFLIHFLKKNEKLNKSFIVQPNVKGASEAKLFYCVKAVSKNYYLLEVELFTGKHHQIRAQLAAIGCPIKGDVKYGARRCNKNASIYLHSYYVYFEHPIHVGKIVEIKAPPPDETLWNYFKLFL
ncbi:MAG TPA: RNA pseudouridine synthase [Bacteroidales bacterium]|nr:RNA pseudouridine synthase [Bacteroidales bacterium]